ncbi:MAG: YggS family pyridoxal phosphate-dependent enzyme [Chitinispirillaceae bacterium]|nr:YggS family pyridoxal phosphate-dependent enzyme [Chitinispirillaceae bacterium]
MDITERYRQIRKEIPGHVAVVIAAKTRSAEDVRHAIEAGATDIGENYVQEAERIRQELGPAAGSVRWHLIGHLQKNKVNKALPLFDVFQTVDSVPLAESINKRADGIVPVYIEINSGREPQKSGALPEDAEQLIRSIALFDKIKVEGLMTMGPRFGDPEDARPYFRITKELFDHISALKVPRVEMKVLSMGMSNSYRIAIEEGSTMVRLGTTLFGTCRYDVKPGI